MVLRRRNKRTAVWSETPKKLCDACFWDLVDAANGAFMSDVGVARHAHYIEKVPTS